MDHDDLPLNQCANCSKTAFHFDKPLKPCAKCKQTVYCSRACQTQHWKSRKKECGKPRPTSAATSSSSPATSPEPASFLQLSHPHPFQALTKHQWLSNRPEQDVYKVLLDSFRLRLEDYFSSNDEIKLAQSTTMTTTAVSMHSKTVPAHGGCQGPAARVVVWR